MKITVSPDAERFFVWRKEQRRKPRVMTWAEYQAWCRGGDLISHPSDSNAMTGGLTIKLGPASGVIGEIVGFEPFDPAST